MRIKFDLLTNLSEHFFGQNMTFWVKKVIGRSKIIFTELTTLEWWISRLMLDLFFK